MASIYIPRCVLCGKFMSVQAFTEDGKPTHHKCKGKSWPIKDDWDEWSPAGPIEENERPIDQIHCLDCGRPMIIWADEEIKHYTCLRCRRGLPPEWEY